MPLRRPLEPVCQAQNLFVLEIASGNHQADREAAVGEAARERNRGMAGQVEDAGVLPGI